MNKKPNDPQNNDKIISFPTPEERKAALNKIEQEKKAQKQTQEKQWRTQYKNERKTKTNQYTQTAHVTTPSAINGQNEPFLKIGNIPPFARALTLILLLIHLPLYLLIDDTTRLETIYALGFTPATFTGSMEFTWLTAITPLTHALIHGSWMHLIFNIIMGLMLGIFLERMIGTRKTTIFFITCILGGALTAFLLSPTSNAPIVGASGGINGLFGAMIYITITQAGNPLAERFGKYGPWPILILWGAFMILPALMGSGNDISWQTHLGGYLTGITLILLIKKGKLNF